MKSSALLVACAVAAAVLGGVPPAASASGRGGGLWALQNGSEAGGYPLGGSGPSGTQVKFIDHAGFWIGVLLKNSSKTQPLTIVGAKTAKPAQSLVSQVGVAFAPYTPCSGDRLCSYLGDPRHPPSADALAVAPGHFVAIKLSYKLVSCAQAASSTTASGNSLIVSYRLGGGRVRQQAFPLGGAKLLLERPVGEACLPRPYSYIGLVGSFNTSPEHPTFPGSDGDTCSLSLARGLSFTSRQFFDREGIVWRVKIQLPQFDGVGSYGAPTAKAKVRGPAQITVIGGFGQTSYTTFVESHGTVTVTKAASSLYGGRFQAVLSGHHRFFRAYGNWRCTTRVK
jgi:hypothetical protein